MFRWGGDEFLVLISCREEEAVRKGRELQKAFAQSPRRPRCRPASASASAASRCPPTPTDIMPIVQVADERMYLDKKTLSAGRSVRRLRSIGSTEDRRRLESQSYEPSAQRTAVEPSTSPIEQVLVPQQPPARFARRDQMPAMAAGSSPVRMPREPVLRAEQPRGRFELVLGAVQLAAAARRSRRRRAPGGARRGRSRS